MAERKSKKSDKDSTLDALESAVRSGVLKSWDWSWRGFLENAVHRDWWERHTTSARPVYVLDPDIIQSLAAPSGKRGPAISKSDRNIELAFAHCCRDFSADTVGVWQGRPIKYGLLSPVNAVSDALLNSLRWGMTLEEKKARLAELDADAEKVNRNRRRWAGELLCNERFLSACAELHKNWNALGCMVEFPLKRHGLGVHLVDHDSASGKLPKKVKQFLIGVREILDRFELTELTTFDLPLPFGPMENMPAKTLGNLMGDVVISSVQPQNYAVPSQKSITTASRILLPGAKPHEHQTRPALRPVEPSLYERAFEMRFIELAFRSRYAMPRGSVDSLSAAMAGKFSIDLERVRQIRKEYVRFLPTK